MVVKLKTMERVMLINAPTPENRNAAGNYSAFPALGVVSLGTRLQNDFPGLEVRVLDGGLRSRDELQREIDGYQPSLLGISILTPTYGEGLALAEYAKLHYHSTIVLGNDHASFFPELILEKRPFVDYVVRAEIGELPLSWIVGRELGEDVNVPHLLEGEEKVYWRSSSGIQQKAFQKLRLSQVYREPMDIPNLNLIAEELQIARESYNEKYGHHHKKERTPMIINNVRGCGNGEVRCTYCSIYDLSLNTGSSEFFWKNVASYHERYGINFFFEVCDSFLTFQKYIRQLIAAMPFNPREKDIEFEIYARANDVVNTPKAIAWLTQLNVTRVNLGLDSGDDNMLKFLRKMNRDKKGVLSPAQINYEAVKRLAEAGISIHASFPLGSLGETSKSLDNTLAFIEKLASDFGSSIATLEASELVPLPHSPCWDLLLSRENSVFDFNGGIEATLHEAGVVVGPETKMQLKEKYEYQDLLDTEELAHDWVKHFTHISWGDIERGRECVEKIAKRIGAIFGRAL